MYTAAYRTELRAALLDRARADSRVSAAAVTGSAATDAQDPWSDVDLAFGIRDSGGIADVLQDWTAHLYGEHDAVAHTDVRAGNWIYRVFLLRNTLQVDLAFVPQADFRRGGPRSRWCLASRAHRYRFHRQMPRGSSEWRGCMRCTCAAQWSEAEWWQAAHMINGTREHVLLLACLRHGLSTHHARGYDQLPAELLARLAASFVRELSATELRRAFAVVVEALLAEIRLADAELAGRLHAPLLSMV